MPIWPVDGFFASVRSMGLREEQIEWLGRVLSQTGLTRHGLAVKAEIPPPTLSMFVSPRAKHNLSSGNVRKIERATGLRFGAGESHLVARENEAEPYRAESDADPFGAIVAAAVGGANHLAPWRLASRALEAAGYLPGDALIVDLNAAAEPGDVVCAQRYNWRAMTAETVFRIFEPPATLVSATLDPALRRPILVDDEHVKIKGVVVASVRPRQARSS